MLDKKEVFLHFEQKKQSTLLACIAQILTATDQETKQAIIRKAYEEMTGFDEAQQEIWSVWSD